MVPGSAAEGMVFIAVSVEFKVQINEYLKTKPGSIRKPSTNWSTAAGICQHGQDGAGPNPTRWRLLRDRDLPSVPMTDPGYIAMINYFCR
jgi:hypothetical protein